MNYVDFFSSRCGSLGKVWDNVQTIHVWFAMHVVFLPERKDWTDVMVEDVDSGRQEVLCSFPIYAVCVFREEPL